ncbi:MAG: hypothetical protein ACRC6T_11065 [Sarcina sp.]
MRSKKELTRVKGIKIELKRYLKQGLITKEDLITTGKVEEGYVNPLLVALEKGRKLSR